MLLSYRGVESIVQMAGFDDVSTGLLTIPRAANCCSTFSCLPSFFAGILVLALVEIVCVFLIVSRFLTKKARHPSSSSSLEYPIEADSTNFSLQGDLWVAPLPEGDWSKAVLHKPGKDKKKEKEAEKDGSKDGSNRGESTKDVLEIAPVRRHAILREQTLVLDGGDGVVEHISLEGCEVLSVSAGESPGGKWAKRFPIKLHHPSRTLYRECKDCLFYAESGYEKEAWCEVLRAVATANAWCTNLKKEFKEYTDGAGRHVPYVSSFYPTREANNVIAVRKEEKSDEDKSSEEGVSKKRLFLTKWLRRNSKGKNSKESTRSPNALEEFGNFARRLSLAQNEGSSSGKEKESPITDGTEDSKSGSRASHVSNESISRSESASSDSDGEKSALAITQKDRKESDEVLPAGVVHDHENERVEKDMDQGLLCLNMLVGRLFFDFYHSETRVAWLQKQFQRLISKIKTPSYIKSITIKELDLGKDPPFATALRMLPADSAGALALEVDLEWYGGGFITIETRVDVRDQIAQEKVASQMAEPGSAGAAAAAIVSGIGEDLETADVSSAVEGKQVLITKKPGPGDDSSKKGGWINSVKSMMSRVADQVSQVPLLLKIRLVSVKGTCIVKLRAPPSDRIWFSFKEMPDIDLEPEPCIGDRRISSGPLGNFIASQIKVQIRESIVTPYFQDVFLHWMMAEKEDWLPQSAIPVAFSTVQTSDRPGSKHILDTQSKPVEENEKSGQSLSSRNGQNKPQRLLTEAPSHNTGHDSIALVTPPSQSSSYEPSIAQMPPPTPPSQSSLQASGTNRNHSRSATSSEPSNFEHSYPSRPAGGASVRSSAPPSIREDYESDSTTPFLNDDDFRDKLSDLSSELDARASSDRATTRPFDRDFLQHPEGSPSLSESQNSQLQVGQEHTKSDLSKDSDSNVSSRRTKMLSLGKKGITKLDERRRIVLEKLREKRAEAGEGGSSRHSSGHLGSS